MNPVSEIEARLNSRRRFKSWSEDIIVSSLFNFKNQGLAKAPFSKSTYNDHDVKVLYEEKDDHQDAVIFECASVYSTPPQKQPEILEAHFGKRLPESFMEIYRRFGEVLFITQGWPCAMMHIDQIIDHYESESYEGNPEMGRYFKFANFPGGRLLYYGLRQNEFTDAWEVVACNYGKLYHEMIGPDGRDFVVSASFEEWFEERWLRRDGKPELVFSVYGVDGMDEDSQYMEALSPP